jgi:cytochrome c-type biogenesis protein CcmE
MKQRKIGAFVTGIVVLLALALVSTAFLANASPYVTVSQARNSTGDRLHLSGDLQQDSVAQDFKNHLITFRLKDQEGTVVTVVYSGPPPANLGEAKKVVAIGGMKDGKFYSDQLLVKCPSKYEGQKDKKA